jgi:tetratricopeptide (TPR) repeat protein
MKPRGWLAPAGLVFAVSMALYLLTLCPTVYSGDSGDLTTASYTLGVAHPTGYPFYMIVGKAFSLIPLGNVAYRYNLLSAVFCALSGVFICLSIRLLTKSDPAAVGGGLMVAFSTSVWNQATVAQTHGLLGTFVAALVYLSLRWREKGEAKWLILATITFGLGLTNHVSLIFYLPAFAYLVWAGMGKALKKADRKVALASFFAPLLLYLYLPLRALSNPPYNWGNPDTVQRFLSHVTVSIHRQTYILTLGAGDLVNRLGSVIFLYVRQYHLAGLIALAGIYQWRARNRALVNFTGLLVGGDFVYTLFLNDVSLDITTFGIPSAVAFGLWVGYGLVDLSAWAKGRMKRSRRDLIACALVVSFVIAMNYHISDKSQNLLAYDYANNLLKTAGKGAVIFAQGDNVVMPLSYLLLAEKTRPDVTMIEQNGLLSHQFYGDDYVWLEYREHEARKQEREYAMVKSGRPVFYTAKPDYTFPGYKIAKVGLLYWVYRENDSIRIPNMWTKYDYRQVWNTTVYLDYMSRNIKASYYVSLAEEYMGSDKSKAEYLLGRVVEIMPDSADARYDLGNVLLGEGNYTRAVEQFNQAISMDGTKANYHNNLGYAKQLQGYRDEAITEYKKALTLDPYYATARFNLASALMSADKLAEAEQQFKVVLAEDPTYAKAFLNLGIMYYRSGKYQQAQDAWTHYLQMNPTDEMAPSIMDTIAQIKAGNITASAGVAGKAVLEAVP